MEPSSSVLLITFPRFPSVKMVFRLRREGLEKKRGQPPSRTTPWRKWIPCPSPGQGPSFLPSPPSGHAGQPQTRARRGADWGGGGLPASFPWLLVRSPPPLGSPQERISFLPVSSTPIRSSFSATSSYCRFGRQKTGSNLLRRNDGDGGGPAFGGGGGRETRPPAQGAHLELHQAVGVGLEVAKVDLAHGVHVLVPDLLGDDPLVAQQELVEKPATKEEGLRSSPTP